MRQPIRSSIVAATLLAVAAFTPSLTAQGRAVAPAARDLVVRAAQALGGETALRGVNTVETRFIGTTFGIGQEESWASPARPTTVNGRAIADYAGVRRSQSLETRPAATPTGAAASRQVLTADYGVTEVNGTWAPMAATALRAAQRTMRQQPERLVLFALDNPSAVRAIPTRQWREETLDGVRIVQGNDSIALYFDRVNGRPTLAVAVTDDAILGDRTTETAYTRWTPTGAVMLPRQVDVYANGRMLSTTQVWQGEVNGTVDEGMFGVDGALAVRAGNAAQLAPVPLSVVLVPLGPGVWRAEGSTHHTLVIEQGNGLLLIETPQSADRMRAVLDTLASRFPGKAINQAVNTHHHWDHSSGLRETMSRGIPMLTHQRNVAFLERIAAAPKSMAPDALSRGGRRPAVRGISDTLVLGSGASTVVIYPINTIHAEGMLAVFVPSVGVLFASDVVNPPVAPNPAAILPAIGSAELIAFAKARGLTVRTYAGGHGIAVPWADIERAATPPR